MANPAPRLISASASKSRCTSPPAERRGWSGAPRRRRRRVGSSATPLGPPPPMRITVLGSAAGGGFPQWNCNCRNCAGVRAGTLRAKPRTQSSIFVQPDDGVDGVLFNASPDILEQIRSQPGAAAGARAARHGDRRRRADGRPDRPRDRPVHAARARHAAAAVVHRPGRRRPEPGQPGAARARRTTAACERHRIALDGSAVRRCPASPDLRFRALPLSSKAAPYSPHRERPVPGDNIGMLDHRPRAAARSAVLRAGARRDHAARCSTRWPAPTACWSTAPSGPTTRCCGSASAARRRATSATCRSRAPGGMIEWLAKLPRAHAAHADPHQQHQPDPRRRLAPSARR